MRLSQTVRPHPTYARQNTARRAVIDALGDPELTHRQIPFAVDVMGLHPDTLLELAEMVRRVRGVRDHGRPTQDHLPLLPEQHQG
jgi:hypothetical protein